MILQFVMIWYICVMTYDVCVFMWNREMYFVCMYIRKDHISVMNKICSMSRILRNIVEYTAKVFKYTSIMPQKISSDK